MAKDAPRLVSFASLLELHVCQRPGENAGNEPTTIICSNSGVERQNNACTKGSGPLPCLGVPPAERAQETGLAERSLRRASDAFDTHGIISLFRPTKAQREDHHRSFPVAMRQLIVDRKR